ncbi:MAG: energy transducer TonB [Candidatus Eisenbacteria bacterium]|nr:energy transducer TonB [Candidatus Eisenbacteria bacterium]
MARLVATENVKFKLGFRKYFDLALIAAVLLHMIGFVWTPEVNVEAYVTEKEEEIVVLEVPEEVEVPLPPVEAIRPSIPLAAELTEVLASDEADPEETIQDTEVNVKNPTAARLNYVDPGEMGGGDAEFLTYSDPPMEKRIFRPDYPALARQAGIEGTVVAKVYIDEKGRVIRVEIVQSPAEIFNEPVKQALFKSEFYPAKQRDIPVKSRILVPFEFYIRSGQR